MKPLRLYSIRSLPPAVLFTWQTQLLIHAGEHLDSTTYQSLGLVKIVITACLSWLLYGRVLCLRRVLSLILLVLGTGLVVSDQSRSARTQNQGFACLAVVLAGIMSSLATVMTEHYLKAAPSFWHVNVELSFAGALVALVQLAMSERTRFSQGGMFQGFSVIVCFLICLQTLTGLSTGLLLQTSDSNVKNFAASASLILTFIVECACGLKTGEYIALCGIGCVCAGVWLYGGMMCEQQTSCSTHDVNSGDGRRRFAECSFLLTTWRRTFLLLFALCLVKSRIEQRPQFSWRRVANVEPRAKVIQSSSNIPLGVYVPLHFRQDTHHASPLALCFVFASFIEIGGIESWFWMLQKSTFGVPPMSVYAVEVLDAWGAHVPERFAQLGILWNPGVQVMMRSCDVLVENGFRYGRTPLAESQYWLHTPRIMVLHGASEWSRSFARHALEYDAIVGVSRSATHLGLEYAPHTHNVTIPSFIDARGFKPMLSRESLLKLWNIPKDKRILLFLGRLSPEKRPMEFYDVVANLSDRWIGLLVGPANFDLPEIVPPSSLTPRLVFAGGWNNSADALSLSDALLVSSMDEGGPIVVLESWVMRKPVFMRKIGFGAENPGAVFLIDRNTTAADIARNIELIQTQLHTNAVRKVLDAGYNAATTRHSPKTVHLAWVSLISKVCDSQLILPARPQIAYDGGIFGHSWSGKSFTLFAQIRGENLASRATVVVPSRGCATIGLDVVAAIFPRGPHQVGKVTLPNSSTFKGWKLVTGNNFIRVPTHYLPHNVTLWFHLLPGTTVDVVVGCDWRYPRMSQDVVYDDTREQLNAPMTLLVTAMESQLDGGCFDKFWYSLKAQTLVPAEIIFVVRANQWNPRLVKLLEDYGRRKCGRYACHFFCKVGGLKGDALNMGISFASASYITAFDVDDLMHPQRIEILHGTLSRHPSIDILLHGFLLGEGGALFTSHKLTKPGAWTTYRKSPKLRYDMEQIRDAYMAYATHRNVSLADMGRDMNYTVVHHYLFEFGNPAACCLLVDGFHAANGWLTARTETLRKVGYPSSNIGEDVGFIFRAAVAWNATINVLDADLGWYNQGANRSISC